MGGDIIMEDTTPFLRACYIPLNSGSPPKKNGDRVKPIFSGCTKLNCSNFLDMKQSAKNLIKLCTLFRQPVQLLPGDIDGYIKKSQV